MTKSRIVLITAIILSICLVFCNITVSANGKNIGNAMPKPTSKNLEEVVFWTCATPDSYKTFTGNDAKTLLEIVNKYEFELTNITKEDITNNQGDYYKLTFKYNDDSKYEFSYNGYYYTDVANGFFKMKNNENSYCPIAYNIFSMGHKIYSFKKPSDPIEYMELPKISTENVASCVFKASSTRYTFSDDNTYKLINYLNTCQFYTAHHGISTHNPVNYSPYKITITYKDSSVVELKNDCCITINTKEGFYFQKEIDCYPISGYVLLFCEPQEFTP